MADKLTIGQGQDQPVEEAFERRLSKLGGIDYLAELLAGGPAWQRRELRILHGARSL